MELHSTHKEVITDGITNKSYAFKIKNSSKVFALLSDKMYKDKPLAVVRELGCNALDASAGRAFDVHIPNDLEPYFEIKDYGTGLSNDDVLDLYTTYGESTKDKSNLFIGAMGIGSKSPFAYTKAFTIESRFNGKKRTYFAAVNKGEPTITLHDTVATEEHNGLTIKVPVKSEDISAFKNAVREVYSRFSVRPKVNGSPDFHWHDPVYSLEGPDWKLTSNGKLMAVMGEVAYPISFDALRINSYNDPLYKFRNLKGDLFFPLGALDVAASREELSYDPETIAAIKERFEKMQNDCMVTVASEVKKAKTLYEAVQTRYKAISAVSRIVTNTSSFLLLWKGKEVPAELTYNVPQDDEHDAWFIPSYEFRKKTLTLSKHNVYQTISTDAYDKTYIIMTEKETRIPSRLLTYVREHPELTNAVILLKDYDRAIQNKMKKDGVVNWIDFKDIPAYKVERVRNPKNKMGSLLVQSKYHSGGWVTYKGDVDLDKDTGYYVDLRREDPQYTNQLGKKDTWCPSIALNSYIMEAKLVGLLPSDVVVFGINGSTKNKMEGHKNWKNLPHYISDAVSTRIKRNKRTVSKLMRCRANDSADKLLRYLITSTPDDILSKYRTPLSKDKAELFSKLVRLYNATSMIHGDAIQSHINSDGTLVIEQILNDYPMLNGLDGFAGHGRMSEAQLEIVVEYIRMIDTMKKGN